MATRARILADYVSSGDELAATTTLATNALPKAGGAMTGAITTNSTFDGIDIATRDAVLTSTTTTAGAALPKAGGTMTGNIVMGDDTSIGIADDAERIEFDGAGDISILGAKLGVGTDAPVSTTLVEIEHLSPAADGPLIVGEKQASGYTGSVIISRMYRGGATATARFLTCISDYDSSSEIEFKIFNDGSSYNDAGTWGTGADYAEFFEWKDGNPSNEDRVGFTVVLDGDKIRKAEEGETPIGVVSTNPAVVGDVAWSKWSQKYLKDDFGRGILEEYTTTEWTDADGKDRQYVTDRIPDDVIVPDNATVISEDADGNKFERGIINPDFDDSLEYIQRKDRKEWDAIGLLGKLRILKDQPVSDTWIKMKDISVSIEMWLVK